jgi:hypothetical protein
VADTTADDADAAAGYRSVLDPADAQDLGGADPNVAVCGDDDDLDAVIGGPADDDGGVAAAGAALPQDGGQH